MLVFSHELFSIQNYGGVTRGMVDLMRALAEENYPWITWAGRHGSEPLEQLRVELGTRAEINGTKVSVLPGRRYTSTINEYRFRKFLKANGRSVVHRTQYAPLNMVPKDVRIVSTLHDLWTERSTASVQDKVRSLFKYRSLVSSDRIVCVSEFTKDEAARTWPELIPKLRVIHHGIRSLAPSEKEPAVAYPYYLYVGSREARKMFPTVLKALASSTHLKGVHLICVGGGPFNSAEQVDIHAGSLHQRVHQLDADDKVLVGLYRSAVALLYPSSYEGFGLPLLEAMLYGCPIVSSPASCLREIGAEAVLYADYRSPDSWREQMEVLASESSVRTALQAEGHRRVGQFSWRHTAQKHIELYHELLE